MAGPATTSTLETADSLDDAGSDYGSDFSPEQERIVDALLSQEQLAHVAEDNPIITDIEDEPQEGLRLPGLVRTEHFCPLFESARAAEGFAQQISEPIKTSNSTDLSHEAKEEAPDLEREISPDAQLPDTRSPLERFRTPPRKALSVTDLVSPAWCELQYWYTLVKFGRKPRTREMKAGSKVHKFLENQVHTTIQVAVQTKEDKWGLRLWNVIQGLRTLRDTGLTRELEVWGIVDGLVVNGIIDELSYICPDVELEERVRTPPPRDQPPPDQSSIADFFRSHGETSLVEETRGKKRIQSKKVYLGDVKTRGARTLPSDVAFRPTRMQLQLYHYLLSALMTNNVEFSTIAERYNINPLKVFSDEFITQVGSLNSEFEASPQPRESRDDPPNSSQDSLSTLLAHNTLAALWSLMISEFQITFPEGVNSLGKILRAEYRSRLTGDVIGNKTFAMDDQELEAYLNSEMQWWRGEREAKGVTIEEASKCRSCDFADVCGWRLKKVEEAKEKVRMTRRRTAAV